VSDTRLSRRLNTFDAVMIGLGAMIGAGVFSAVAPAARAAGASILIALGIAGCVAYLNATSMAQLAAVYPQSGGAYVYGRERLGHFWGFLAGFGFITGKLASCAAMAMTFAHYAFPSYARIAAVSAVIALTIVNCFGIQKTALMTRIIVAIVLSVLTIVVGASLAGGAVDTSRLAHVLDGGVRGTLQAAGLLFFAFAGYARLATLGEEVIDPKKTIPRAIPLALGIVLVVYASVLITALLCVDTNVLAHSDAPLVDAVRSGSYAWVSPVVRVGAAIASVGVLLSLLAGIGRTTFAMAQNKDLPTFLGAVHERFKVPHRAEIAAGAIVVVIAALGDVRSAIGFSSFCVLTYYAIANSAALKLRDDERMKPRVLSGLGVIGCLVVAFTLPWVSVVAGAGVLTLGAIAFMIKRALK
jgi:basic amino acid/polyamine antiporter, APA family